MKVRLFILLSILGCFLPSSVLAGSHQSNQKYFSSYKNTRGKGHSKDYSQQLKDYDDFCKRYGSDCKDYKDFEKKFDHYCKNPPPPPPPDDADLPFHAVVTGTTLLGFTTSASSQAYVNGAGGPAAGIPAGSYPVFNADGVTPRGYIIVTSGGAYSWSLTP